MGDYANEASRINDQIRQYKEAPIDSIGDMAEEKTAGIQAKLNSRVAEYTDKWTHIKEMGDEELAGVAGIEVLKKGYKTAKGIYSKYQAAKNGAKKPVGEDGEGEEGSGEGGGASAGGEGGGAAAGGEASASGGGAAAGGEASASATTTTATSAATEASPFAYEGGLEGEEAVLTGARTTEITIASQATEGEATGILSRAGSAIKGFVGRQVAKNTAEEASGEGIADAVGTGVAAAGEGASLGLAGALSAVPVVGEGLLAVAGLVSLGEGIYHLFHHPHPKAPQGITPTNLALPTASGQLTSKYAMALPDIDTSQDRMASVASF